MITLIHGEDIRRSREALLELKQQLQGKELREINGKTVQDADLVQALSSSSLFGGETVVIIERIFSGLGKKIKRIDELTTLITTQGKDVDIIFWEDKEVGKTVLAGLGNKTAVRVFKLPSIIFQFLDSIAPGNSKTLLTYYDNLIQQEPPDLIHAMLLKRIKQLLILKSGNVLEGQQAWQLTRLTNQSRPFTLERLLSLYHKFRKIEYNRNSGTGIFDITEATQLILVTL